MSLFRPSGSGPSVVPLTSELIIECMKALNYRHFVDSDDDVGGFWDGHPFYFMIIGKQQDTFCVRGEWRRRLPSGLAAQATQVVNDWNRDRVFPKGYVRVTDTGEVEVYAELNTDLEAGVTMDQLSILIKCGVGAGCAMFDFMGEQFPDLAGAPMPTLDG